jgi:hypothetical protein
LAICPAEMPDLRGRTTVRVHGGPVQIPAGLDELFGRCEIRSQAELSTRMANAWHQTSPNPQDLGEIALFEVTARIESRPTDTHSER